MLNLVVHEKSLITSEPVCVLRCTFFSLVRFYPLKSYFYIVKLSLQVYTLFVLLLLKNLDCGYSLEPPRRCNSNEYPQSMFWAEIWKI